MTDNYYKITVSYEIPIDVIDDDDEAVASPRRILYENLKEAIPDRYEIFTIKMQVSQLTDTGNYIVTYEALFRSLDGLPMEEYVAARDIKDKVKGELEQFFDTVGCDYRNIPIKALV